MNDRFYALVGSSLLSISFLYIFSFIMHYYAGVMLSYWWGFPTVVLIAIAFVYCIAMTIYYFIEWAIN